MNLLLFASRVPIFGTKKIVTKYKLLFRFPVGLYRLCPSSRLQNGVLEMQETIHCARSPERHYACLPLQDPGETKRIFPHKASHTNQGSF